MCGGGGMGIKIVLQLLYITDYYYISTGYVWRRRDEYYNYSIALTIVRAMCGGGGMSITITL
jgi:hypothetical protein